MIFSEAFDRLRGGERIRMAEWSPGTFLYIRFVDDKAVIELYIDRGLNRITWAPTQRELLAVDWEIAPQPDPKVIIPDTWSGIF